MTRHHQNSLLDSYIIGQNDSNAPFNRDFEFEYHENDDAFCDTCGTNILGEVHDDLGYCPDCREFVPVTWEEE